MKEYIKKITSLDYISSFIDGAPLSLVVKRDPVQIYNYEILAKYLKTPTPLFRPDYSYVIHLSGGCIEMQIGIYKKIINSPAIISVNSGTISALLKLSKDVKGSLLVIENSSLQNIVTTQNLLNLFEMNEVVQLTDNSSNWITSITNLISIESAHYIPNSDVLNSLIQSFIFKVAELAGKRKDFSKSEFVCLEFRKLVSKNFLHHKEVSFYTEKMLITENYLNRCVKKELGKSAKTVITEMWMLQSQLLLQDHNMNISEIAIALNFTDVSYFGRVFKKYLGQTPSQYRAGLWHEKSGN